MRIAFGQTCSCGAALVARTIQPETIWVRGGVRGLLISETCANGHVANFTCESVTMTDLAGAGVSNQDTKQEGT